MILRHCNARETGCDSPRHGRGDVPRAEDAAQANGSISGSFLTDAIFNRMMGGTET